MNNSFKIKLVIIAGVLFTFLTVFFLLQKTSIYHSTLGLISSNYTHIKDDKKFKVEPYEKPYESILSSNIYKWDAKIYRSIRDSSYIGSEKHYRERLAFFPLYAYVWKYTFIDSPLIFVFNYFTFLAGLLLLFHLLVPEGRNRIFVFVAGLLVPSAIVYYLPYAESLFLLTF